jgi:putative iron-regulated protein
MRTLAAFALLSGNLLLFGCQNEKPRAEPAPEAKPVDLAAFLPALVTYADIAHAVYSDSLASARALLKATEALRAEPRPETFDAAQKAWIAARKPYAQSEVFRFCDGPIDKVELLVNTWPIDENYVESAGSTAPPGIVENLGAYPDLSLELLTKLNGKDGETSISTGYHVIEFLLWGRDTRPSGPGDRPYTDYVAQKSAQAARRGQYLSRSAELLIQHLGEVTDAWAPDRPGNYRSTFLALPPAQALTLALKGMGSLGGPELAGERLTVAYETKDQENEHSCFSDTTHADLLGNALGIENLCTGRYRRTDGSELAGTGLCQAIATRDPKLAEQLKQQMAASIAALGAIPAPFDQAILGSDDASGRKAVQRSIAALEGQTRTLTKVAALLDLRLSLAVVGGNP